MKRTVSRILILTMLTLMCATIAENITGTEHVCAPVVKAEGIEKSETTEASSEKTSEAETPATKTTEAAGIAAAATKEAPKDCVIPDDADFEYDEILYKPASAYDPEREPMNSVKMEVTYKGTKYPAYYWAPGERVVLLVGLADTDVTPWEELSQSDQDTWKSWMSDKYSTPEEAYYADALPTYTFYFDFEQNKIRPFVEFQYGPDGKVVMTDFNEDQAYYLDSLSPSFLKLGNFEFDVYQFLTVNDDTCYYIFSGLDQLGNCYLYQYDANGNCCARADMNLLIAVKYLEERTIALNEYVTKVQHYQDVVRKIIAGIILAVIITLIVLINIFVHKRMKAADEEDEDDEDGEDEEDDDDEDDDDVIAISEGPDDLDEEEDGIVLEFYDADAETSSAGTSMSAGDLDDSDDEDTETAVDEDDSEYFYAADTEEMKAMFSESVDDDEYYDDEDDSDEEDDEDDLEDIDDLDDEVEDLDEVIPAKPVKVKKEKPEKIKKEKIKKEKIKKEKPAKKSKFLKHAEQEVDKEDDVLDLNDL